MDHTMKMFDWLGLQKSPIYSTLAHTSGSRNEHQTELGMDWIRLGNFFKNLRARPDLDLVNEKRMPHFCC